MSKRIEDLLSPHLRSLRAYVPDKRVEDLERELNVRVAAMAANENPLGPSPRAVQAAREFLEKANRYPDRQEALRQKLAERFGLRSEQVVLGCGSTEVLEMVGKVFLQGGVEAVTAEGSFVVYYKVAQMMGAAMRRVPLKNYTYDVDAIAAAVTPRTRVIFFANPNNPTGTFVRPGEMDRLLAQLPEDVLLVLDEAYAEYVEDPDYSRSIEYVREGRRVLVTRTFSKVYGLAGLRIGYGLGSAELMDCLNRVRSPFNNSGVALAAAEAALDDHAHVAASLAHNRREMAWLRARLEEIGAGCIPSVTNFLLAEIGRDAEEMAQSLLGEGLIVRPMKEYGFATCLRVSIGLHDENARVVEALKRLGVRRARVPV